MKRILSRFDFCTPNYFSFLFGGFPPSPLFDSLGRLLFPSPTGLSMEGVFPSLIGIHPTVDKEYIRRSIAAINWQIDH